MKHISVFLLLFLSAIIAQSQDILIGADLSYLNEMEDCGAVYYENTTKNHEANIIRYRLWHTPNWTIYSNFSDVKLAISRAKSKGFKVLLDFHYSDIWADSGQQLRLAAWNGITDNAILADSVYQYTFKVLNTLNNQGLMPEYVQIGNETNPNIMLKEGEDLWPLNWNRNVPLFEAGILAVNDVSNNSEIKAKTIIHIADPNNLDW